MGERNKSVALLEYLKSAPAHLQGGAGAYMLATFTALLPFWVVFFEPEGLSLSIL